MQFVRFVRKRQGKTCDISDPMTAQDWKAKARNNYCTLNFFLNVMLTELSDDFKLYNDECFLCFFENEAKCAAMNPITINTPDIQPITMKLINTGVTLCTVENFISKYECGIKNNIVCNMTSEINNPFNSRFCYPAPC